MKKYFAYIFMVLITLVVLVSHTLAAENSFTTQLTVGPDDTANPTIPTGLTATAISSSQINLIWNASTDDIGVDGYRIFRDSAIIATTSSLTYSDAGLAASTTYEYTVEAFDATLKYSGQSAVASSTTFGITVTPPDPGSGSSGSQELMIVGVNASATQDSAMINFSTNRATQSKVYWGTTKDYELGSVSGLFYDFRHSTKIDNLNPGTNYFFKIEATDGIGRIKTLEGFFQTQSGTEEPLLTNVTNFKATPQEKSIALSWKNPSSPTFDSVRVIRSDRFFPRDINDGEIVYEGSDERYQDVDVIAGITYYYSIFARDTDGNYSSGALAQARIKSKGEPSKPATSTDPFVDIPILTNVHPQISELKITDFDFLQSSIKLVNIGTGVVIDGSKNLTISLEYGKVPEILKTIAITLVDPKDSTQVFPFLLRINKEKTAYEATLAPLGRSGTYQMKIVILDYKNQGLKKLEGSLKAFVFGQVKDLSGNQTTSKRNTTAFVLLIIALVVALVVVLKKKRKDEHQ